MSNSQVCPTVNDDLVGLFTVEYSLSQRAFHITDVGSTCTTNLRSVASKRIPNDYVVVGLAKDIHEAFTISENLEKAGICPQGPE
jgi:hypothetical protein